MRFNNISFPHPILCNENDDIRGKVDLTIRNVLENKISYSIQVDFTHDNSLINELIESGQAEYFCEVTCSNTLFRKGFKSSVNQITFELNRKELKGKVEIICTIIAKEKIEKYESILFHPDYFGYEFYLEKGDLLAFFGIHYFNADITYEKIKSASSIMEVKENRNNDSDYTEFDLTHSKIHILLPTKEYLQFADDSIAKEPNYASTFHSSIVLNALLIGLYNIKNHEDTIWAKTINYRLNNDKEFENLNIDDPENIPEIAQRLLGFPFNRLINDLNQFITNQYEYEDE